METVKINVKPVGKNKLFDLRDQINKFVKENFPLLYEGAVRSGCQIPDNYYAPKRVQIGSTRLHEHVGLKYADGHKYSEDAAPSEAQIKKTVKDIQSLIDEASREIEASFSIKIIEN